ncbi:MAG: glycosyltransferase [Elusimicrobia bacterium]|nr:glycosyltransferase [Elusimicrobiota bacterium]
MEIKEKLKLTIIIPTKNRSFKLKSLLNNISGQSCLPDQLIIVDASDNPEIEINKNYMGLKIDYKHVDTPGLTKQRNIGIKMIKEDIDIVCFLDDDVEFEKDSIRNMMKYWDGADKKLGGAVFNILNENKRSIFIFVKEFFLTGSRKTGIVLKSGYNSMIHPAEKTDYVKWLSGGVTVWRKEVFNEFDYDEWYSDYGFCEDLDFSYRVGKKYKLAVVAEAGLYHIKAKSSRINNILLGKSQIINRYHFIQKDKYFSETCFFWAVIGNMLENIFRGVITLKVDLFIISLGNILGLVELIKPKVLGGKI